MGLMGERLAQRDVAIGIVLALSLGFGLLFLHFFTAFATQATALLFGNVLAVDEGTVWTLLALGVVTLAATRHHLPAASVRQPPARACGGEGRLAAAVFRAVPGHRGAGDGGMRADRRRAAGVFPHGRPRGGGPAADQRRRPTAFCSRWLLALAEAWGGITLAFYTDWPSSFWITALSAAAYLLTVLPRPGWAGSPPEV